MCTRVLLMMGGMLLWAMSPGISFSRSDLAKNYDFARNTVLGIYVKPSGRPALDEMYSSTVCLDLISMGYRVKNLNALLNDHGESSMRWKGSDGAVDMALSKSYLLPLNAIIIAEPQWDTALVITEFEQRFTTDGDLTRFAGWKSLRLKSEMEVYDVPTKKKVLDYEGEDTCRLYSEHGDKVPSFSEYPWMVTARQLRTAFKDIPICSFEDTTTASYRFPVIFYVDQAYRNKFPQQWQERLQRRLLYASDIFRKEFDVEFDLIGFKEWDSRFESSLDWTLNKLRATTPELAPAIRIGVTIDEGLTKFWSRRSKIGIAYPLTTLATITAQPSFPSVADWNSLEEALTLVHEIGHLLGAGHSADETSVMYPSAGAMSFAFDAFNKKIIDGMKAGFFSMDEEKRFQLYIKLLTEIHKTGMKNSVNILNPITRAMSRLKSLAYDSFTLPDSNKLNAIYSRVIPDSAIRLAVIGYSQYMEKHLEQAELSLLKVVELEPDFGEVHRCLGDIEKMLGKTGAGENHLKIAKQYGIPESIDD